MSSYMLTDNHVLGMPIKRFWLLSESADRITAMSDLRGVKIASAVLSQDSFTRTVEEYKEAIGTITVKDYEREENAAQKLRAIMNR